MYHSCRIHQVPPTIPDIYLKILRVLIGEGFVAVRRRRVGGDDDESRGE